jgi:hypothetical protein
VELVNGQRPKKFCHNDLKLNLTREYNVQEDQALLDFEYDYEEKTKRR